ncbi:MAG: hypothetical protein ACOC7U_02770 [Spirochaetota bacterium]
MKKIDEREAKIMSILGSKKIEVNSKTLKTYLQFLKQHIEFPCQLTGIEDFDWEEFYLFGPGSKKEYKELKNYVYKCRNLLHSIIKTSILYNIRRYSCHNYPFT